MSLNTPVLLVIFNRPELTSLVLKAISLVKPSTLLVAADGPRTEDERNICEATRSLLSDVSWRCEILRDYSDRNMGCGIRVASAVSWALSKFERVIVLEDDCIPSSSFFFYCEQLLEKYCLDERVMHVGGFNFQPGKTLRCASYYFSKYPLASGGWATWRRAWRHYDWRMKAWPDLKERGVVAGWCPDPLEAEYWTKLFDGVHNGAADVWDYQWNLACWAHGGLSILPTVQLLSNVGFGIDATHTKDPISHLQAPPGEIRKMFHPDQVQQDYELDKFIFDNCFGGALMRHSRSLWVKVRSSVVRALPWLRRLRAVVR